MTTATDQIILLSYLIYALQNLLRVNLCGNSTILCLKIINYVNAINDTIDEIKKQYSLPVNKPENVLNIPENEIQFSITDQLFLDVLLMEIRGKTISYSAYKKKQNDKKEKQLTKDILKLEQNLNEGKFNELEIP